MSIGALSLSKQNCRLFQQLLINRLFDLDILILNYKSFDLHLFFIQKKKFRYGGNCNEGSDIPTGNIERS